MHLLKKVTLYLLLPILACLLLFTGCNKKDLINNSSTGEITPAQKTDAPKDGTYTVTSKYYNPRGYGQKMTIFVLRGIVTKTTYEEINLLGANKLTVPNDRIGWTETTLSLSTIYTRLYTDFMERQSPSIDTISGATQTTDTFKNLAEAALDLSKTGNTTPLVVNDFTWTYMAESALDEITGYKSRLSITFNGDTITQVAYDDYKDDQTKINTMSTKSFYSNFVKETQLKQTLEPVIIDPAYPTESIKYNDLLQKILSQRVIFNLV